MSKSVLKRLATQDEAGLTAYIVKLESKLASCEQDAAKYRSLISQKFEDIDICKWNDDIGEYRLIMLPAKELDEYITKEFKELK